MTALSDELKPCPFCGGAAAVSPRTCDKDTPYNPADRAFPVTRCGQCGAEAVGKNWGRPETAAAAWNARALLAAQPAVQQPKHAPTQLRDCGELMEAIKGMAAMLFGQGAAQQYPFDAWRLLESYIEQMTAIVHEAQRSAVQQPAEDAELLDHLIKTGRHVNYDIDGYRLFESFDGDSINGPFDDGRKAIRAAIKAQGGKQ